MDWLGQIDHENTIQVMEEQIDCIIKGRENSTNKPNFVTGYEKCNTRGSARIHGEGKREKFPGYL